MMDQQQISRILRRAGIAFALCVAIGPAGAGAENEEELRSEVAELRNRVAELEALVRDKLGIDLSGDPAATRSGPSVSLGGQYRINSYSVDNDTSSGRQTAARVRIRQNVDLEFTERFKTHLQVELGHTDSNRTTSSKALRVRHAVIDYTFEQGANFQAGIVPLGDFFGDALFSSDWDYNPVALSLTAPLGGGSLRAFAGNLREGSETSPNDDFVHYQLDYVLPFSDDNQLNVGATLATIGGSDGDTHIHANYGLGGHWRLTDHLRLRSFVLGSHTDQKLIGGASDDANGFATKLELDADCGFGLLATYASGDSDRTGFLPTMALAKTYGYWGYTGILTVQGPTDTGFDGDAVNISNNGHGLATVQAKYARPITDDLGIHLAGGWFGATDAPSNRDSFVGVDFLAMGTYHFNSVLALDFGGAYARLSDSVSGYPMGVTTSAPFPIASPGPSYPFNQARNRERDKYVFFTRLQAEF